MTTITTTAHTEGHFESTEENIATAKNGEEGESEIQFCYVIHLFFRDNKQLKLICVRC